MRVNRCPKCKSTRLRLSIISYEMQKGNSLIEMHCENCNTIKRAELSFNYEDALNNTTQPKEEREYG